MSITMVIALVYINVSLESHIYFFLGFWNLGSLVCITITKIGASSVRRTLSPVVTLGDVGCTLWRRNDWFMSGFGGISQRVLAGLEALESRMESEFSSRMMKTSSQLLYASLSSVITSL